MINYYRIKRFDNHVIFFSIKSLKYLIAIRCMRFEESFYMFSIFNWLAVWNIFYFSIHWECHHPNWLIFFRGVGIPPTRMGHVRAWHMTSATFSDLRGRASAGNSFGYPGVSYLHSCHIVHRASGTHGCGDSCDVKRWVISVISQKEVLICGDFFGIIDTIDDYKCGFVGTYTLSIWFHWLYQWEFQDPKMEVR